MKTKLNFSGVEKTSNERFDLKYRDQEGEIIWEMIHKNMVPVTREEMERDRFEQLAAHRIQKQNGSKSLDEKTEDK